MKKVDKITKKKMKELLIQYPVIKIGKMYNCSSNPIRDRIEALNLQLFYKKILSERRKKQLFKTCSEGGKNGGGYLRNIKVDEINKSKMKKLIKEMTIASIANKYNCSVNPIYRRIEELNLEDFHRKRYLKRRKRQLFKTCSAGGKKASKIVRIKIKTDMNFRKKMQKRGENVGLLTPNRTNIDKFRTLSNEELENLYRKYKTTADFGKKFGVGEHIVSRELHSRGLEYLIDEMWIKSNVERAYNPVTYIELGGIPIRMRSSWEAAFACYLDFIGKKWNYESKRLPFKYYNKIRYYTPDFDVEGRFIEIKGQFTT